MFAARIAVLILGLVASVIAYPADSAYRLRGCGQFKDGVTVGFVGSRGEVRRMFLGPKAVELGGNVKGYAELSLVKELALQPVLEIAYTDGTVISFGPIDAACQRLLRDVGGRLVHIRE